MAPFLLLESPEVLTPDCQPITSSNSSVMIRFFYPNTGSQGGFCSYVIFCILLSSSPILRGRSLSHDLTSPADLQSIVDFSVFSVVEVVRTKEQLPSSLLVEQGPGWCYLLTERMSVARTVIRDNLSINANEIINEGTSICMHLIC